MGEPKFQIGQRVKVRMVGSPVAYVYDVMYSRRYDVWTYVLGSQTYPYEGFYDEEILTLNEETPGS